MEQNKPKNKMKNSLKLSTKVWTLTALLFMGLSTLAWAEKVAIIDAGSSGSRLFVYEVTTTGEQDLRLVYPLTKEQQKLSKGRALSTLANHPDSVRIFVENMTANYCSDSTRLYILATAGMRLKPKAHADAIYQKLEALPLINGYYVKGAMTITGQYEGLYGWLAANYQNGRIGFTTTTTGTQFTLTGTPCGILEIGGASMQIAFTTDHTSHECLTRPGIGNLYSKSYLGAGADQMYQKSPRKGNSYKLQLDLDDVSRWYGKDSQFWGLSHPLNNVLNGMNEYPEKRTVKGRMNAYIRSLDQFTDTPQNYHPRFNSHYIKWLLKEMHLTNRLIQSDKDASWTIGAALDIVINGEEPAEFDHANIR